MIISNTRQASINRVLRAVGALSPKFEGFDFRIAGKMHRYVPQGCSLPWTAGNGFLMGSKTSNASYIMGVNERNFLDCVLRHMNGHGLVINVGANIGYTALYLAKSANLRNVRSLHFLALEPEPRTFSMLQENVALNDLPLTALCVAAGDSDTSAILYSSAEGDGAASFEQRDGASMQGFKVAIRRLDGLLADHRQRVNGLVIDVEGQAGNVLRGATSILLDDRPFVGAEIHSSQELDEIWACLSPLGYELVDQTTSLWGSHRVWKCTPQPAR